MRLARTRTRGGRRARAALALLRAGVPPAQVLAVDVADVKGDRVRVRPVGRRYGGHVTLDPRSAAIVERWAAEVGHGRLFCTRTGKPWDSSDLRRVVARLGQRAGLPERVSPLEVRRVAA